VSAIDDPVVAELLSRCNFAEPDGIDRDRVICAVSGGADSSALLVLAVAAGLTVTAVHVDHGLRAGSAAEADVVAALAAHVGAEFRSVTVRVEPGPNLEARARTARRAALGADALTGHTADDHAETVLINLLRGAGAHGLGGIQPGPTKPLLALRRADTVGLCRRLGIDTVHDASNDDAAFVRNRVRAELLPLLADISRRDAVPLLDRQSRLWRDDDQLLVELSASIDPTDARQLAAAPLPLARRAVRRWLTGEHPPDAATVQRVLDVASGAAVACELPGGARVSRRNQRLYRSDAGKPPPTQ
jgi:tRNA(Ile)-lysidine synthase